MFLELRIPGEENDIEALPAYPGGKAVPMAVFLANDDMGRGRYILELTRLHIVRLRIFFRHL